MNIYVGNLSFQATEEEVKALFEQHGEVLSVKIIKDRDTGRARGFAFVEMEDSAANNAIEALNGFDYNGRQIQVNQAHDKKPNDGRQNFRRGNNNQRFDNRRQRSY